MLQSDFFGTCNEPGTRNLSVIIGTRIASNLASGCHLTRSTIASYFTEETGVNDWGAAWSIDDYNDAVEIGALLWLRTHGRIGLSTNIHEAAARFEWLGAALPPRHVRSENQMELQQFSTPPMLAWLMARSVGLKSGEMLLEPSAGNGALALWPAIAGCKLSLNEIEQRRRTALGHLFPEALISGHDGELVDHLLPDISPSGIILNPPFARSRERGVSGPTAMRHLRSACRLAAENARIAVIMPDGFDVTGFVAKESSLTLRLDVRVSNAFRKIGTGIPVRFVVIDKCTETFRAATADMSDLAELDTLVGDLPPRKRQISNIARLPVRGLSHLAKPPLRVRPDAPFSSSAALLRKPAISCSKSPRARIAGTSFSPIPLAIFWNIGSIAPAGASHSGSPLSDQRTRLWRDRETSAILGEQRPLPSRRVLHLVCSSAGCDIESSTPNAERLGAPSHAGLRTK